MRPYFLTGLVALFAALAFDPVAFAQQPGNQSDMSGMPGMAPGDNGSKGTSTNMQSMMNQCSQMRQVMKPGATMTPGMQKMMTACDEMDRSMNSASQPYTPPTDPTR